MVSQNSDLHGNVPDLADVALLIIDVINDFDFPGGEQLLEHAAPMADALAALKGRAKQAGVPAIYLNDNFGKWQSNINAHLEHCLKASPEGGAIVEKLRPDDDDYIVIKPKNSGFFSTTLDTLLRYLQAKSLVLTGIAGDNCVLFTANDAYMRDFELFIPADCTASIDKAENYHALRLMERLLKADTRESPHLTFTRGKEGKATIARS